MSSKQRLEVELQERNQTIDELRKLLRKRQSKLDKVTKALKAIYQLGLSGEAELSAGNY